MLQLRFADETKPPFWLVASSYTFGASLDNDHVLAQNHVAPEHAKIIVEGEVVRLVRVDMASSTRVNGIEIRQEEELKAGDEITLGTARLHVIDPKSEARAVVEGSASSSTELRQPTQAPLDTETHWFLRPLNTTLVSGDPYPIEAEAILGRSKDSDICVPASHLSRKHARFTYDGNKLKIEDLKSSNGTFVNGKKVQQALELKHGDEVGFDTLRFRVESVVDSEDVTTLRPALDITQVSQAVSSDMRSASQAPRRAATVRPSNSSNKKSASGNDAMSNVALILGAFTVIAVVASLVWLLLK